MTRGARVGADELFALCRMAYPLPIPGNRNDSNRGQRDHDTRDSPQASLRWHHVFLYGRHTRQEMKVMKAPVRLLMVPASVASLAISAIGAFDRFTGRRENGPDFRELRHHAVVPCCVS